ncbi:hypothetical protein AVEN_24068-1 [Araneus ventricosus]|uniref:Endonuclease/exonuclease/phosphatase domain-containing protein n=1 Tax=Araneus ventricosus TaxID=182803 RepID=A0A4Y2NK12_ARAVE|nr:hypothetical protein AVEN_24068-1 [Araneus ventricosus]
MQSTHPITLISAYYTPYSNIQYILQDLRGILSLLQKESIFIDSDLKGHNTVWGYKSNDTRGENIMKFILATDLCLLNTLDSLATFLRHSSVDWPDLTLCSHFLLQYAPHWEVLDDLTNRDYRYILRSIDNPIENYHYIGYKILYGNHHKFPKTLQINTQSIENEI